MSKRQASVPADSAADDSTSKKARSAFTPSPATPVLVGIDSLPRHLLTEIFSYAPPAARLKAISLVCKRWHTAALHAFDTLIFSSGGPFAAAGLASTLARLPSLTSLCVKSATAHFILPTSLRDLTLEILRLPRMAASPRT